MNGAQIRNILSSDTAAKKYFIGIFTSDRLPKDNIPYPSCFVLNTDIEGGAGLHWLAVILKSSEELEFFDSFGRHPKDINTDIYKYIQKFKSAIYNKVQIQSPDSEVCGAYCVYYLFHRCRGLCMDSVLSTFGNKDSRINNECLKNNDISVIEFVEGFFNKPKNSARRRRRNGLWPYGKHRRFLTKP